jgi:Putative adhesin
MPHWEFPGSDPIDAVIDIAAGRVVLAAEPTDVTTVELTAAGAGRADALLSGVRVSFEHGRLEIAGPKRAGLWRGHGALDLAVTMPAGSRCQVRTASADVSCTGDLATLDVNTASGDVTAGIVTGHARIETASGDVQLDEAGADADLHTASGDVHVARAGDAVTVRTASGDVNVGRAASSVSVTASSGDVQLGSVSAGRAEVKTVSGDIVVGVAAGVGVYLDLASLTGATTSQLDDTGASDDVPLEVVCRAVSGDIRITRAAAAGPGPARSFPAPPAVNIPKTPPTAS